MTDIFLKLLNLSFPASILIVVVLLTRLLFKRVPKYILCLLWGLVAIRLVCPFSFESVLSLIPSADPIPSDIERMEMPHIDSGLPLIDNAVNPIIAESFTPSPVESVNPLQIWAVLASWVWLVGLLGMLVYATVSYFLVYRKVRVSVAVEEGIYLCDAVDSSFILGIIRPRIYLPSGIAEEVVPHVIAHENAHIKRLDHWWKPLGFLVLAVYWFHPLVWVAYVMLCRDIELACDEKVVKDMAAEDKRKYSKALVTCNASHRIIAACPLAFGEVGLKTRVKAVLNYRKPTFWILMVAMLLIVVVMACLMTNPVSKEGDAEAQSQEVLPEVHETESAMPEVTPEGVKLLQDKYIDTNQLVAQDRTNVTEYVFEDRRFACEGTVHNELEKIVSDLYYYEAAGNYDKVFALLGESKYLLPAFENSKEAFDEGNYMSELTIHELITLSADDVANASDQTLQYLLRDVELYDLEEFAIVKVVVSWKHNAKSLAMGPQLGDGSYTRCFLLGVTDKVPEYKIYEEYWDDFYQRKPEEKLPGIEQVMEQIVQEIPLEDATNLLLMSTADLPPGNQLYFLDETPGGEYSLYGFHSDGYGYKGLLIRRRTKQGDELTYLGDITNWIGYEYPRIASAGEDGIFLTYCHAGGSGVHVDRLFYLRPGEDNQLERFEFTHDVMLRQAREQIAFLLVEDTETVQILRKNKGERQLLAEMSYTETKNGQELQIRGVKFVSEQIKTIHDPTMIIVGVGLEVEDSILPVYIGEMAFRVQAEQSGKAVTFSLYDASTYSSLGIEDLAIQVESEEAAVALLTEQLITACENKFGPYIPSDMEPTIYSGDVERFAYLIPRLAVTEETERYYVIPFVWEFRVYKETGEVRVYYNGVDPFEYVFDPYNPAHITFAG